jgi:acetyltransferase-like isoleucine patch superfamily enzyme
VSAPLPTGADAVVPARVRPLASRLRLARLRVLARGRLRAEAGVIVAPGARVPVARGGHVTLGAGCALGAGCRIESAGGTVEIGARARIGERAVIVALERVELGERATLGDWAVVTDAEPPRSRSDVETPLREQPVTARPVVVAAGARVGAHAALGAGARVEGSVASYAVVPTPRNSP